MAPTKKSTVWNFFEKIDDKTGKCQLCQKNIKSAGNTTNLMGHIRNVHKAAYLQILSQKSVDNKGLRSSVSSSTKKLSESQSENSTFFISNQPSTSRGTCEESAPVHPVVGDGESEICVSTEESRTIKTRTSDGEKSDEQPEIPIKRQKTITDSFQDLHAFTSTGNKTIRFNNAMLFMICKDNQPFNIVENEGFKHLFKVIAPQYKLPSKQTVTRWLDEKYDVLSKIYKDKLLEVQHITLTTDIWSDSMQMRSFLGITAQFWDKY